MRMRPGVGVLPYVAADGDFRRVTGRISDPYRVRTGPERGQKHPGLGGVDAANLASGDQQIPQTGDIRRKMPTLAKWEPVGEVRSEAVRPNVLGGTDRAL